MNNRLIRIAAIEIAKDPDNIIKVATILGKLKRWISSMFSPAVKQQIQEIDDKYSLIEPLLSSVNEDMQNIEAAIENVDLIEYDNQINQLLIDISKLNEQLLNLKGVIVETKKETIAEKKQGFRVGKIINKGTLYQQYTPGKTLLDTNITSNDIILTNTKESFYRSLESGIFGGFGKGGISTLKDNNFTNDQISDILREIKNKNIFETIIMADISNYEIISLFSRPTSDTARHFKGVLKINGNSKVNTKFGDFNINTTFFVGILEIPYMEKQYKALKVMVESVLPISITNENIDEINLEEPVEPIEPTELTE